jgi:hypothetical protein
VNRVFHVIGKVIPMLAKSGYVVGFMGGVANPLRATFQTAYLVVMLRPEWLRAIIRQERQLLQL